MDSVTLQIAEFAPGPSALRPLMAKIRVTPDPAIDALLPHTDLLRVKATTVDGVSHTLEIVNPLGHPANPMDDTHIEEKFRRLAGPVFGLERCDAVLTSWWRIDESSNLGAALDLLDRATFGHQP